MKRNGGKTMILNFEEFNKVLTDRIKNEFPGYEVVTREIQKDNGVVQPGIEIREPKSNAAPVFYPEKLYDAYQNGTGMDELIEMIKNSVKLAVPYNIAEISKEFILKSVRLSAINTEKNTERLKSVPSFSMLDLSFIPRCILSDNQTASFVVNNDMLKSYGITEEELFESAKANTSKDLHTVTLSTMFAPECGEFPMYAITNRFKTYGAGILGCDKALEKIGDWLYGDYVIIPSSLHEIIVMPAPEVTSVADIREIISMVNETQISRTEYLSNNLYFYDTENGLLKIAEENDLDKEMD